MLTLSKREVEVLAEALRDLDSEYGGLRPEEGALLKRAKEMLDDPDTE